LLHLQQKFLTRSDELTDLIDEEQETIVFPFCGNILLEFFTELFRCRIHSIPCNLLPYDVCREVSDFSCFIHDIVKFCDCKCLSFLIPVESVFRKCILECLILSLILKGFLKILRKSDTEFMIPSESIKLFPYRLCKSCTAVRVVAYLVADVKKDSINVRFLQPFNKIPEVGESRFKFAGLLRQRIKIMLDSIQHAIQSLLPMLWNETEVQILQEM